MKNTMRHIVTAAVVLFVANTAWADDPVINIVHGIRGEDLSLPPSLPVDIALNGNCFQTAVTFGSIMGPFSLNDGTHDIEISPANTTMPYTNPALVSLQINLVADENASIVAHLDAAGNPAATKFTNDLSSIRGNRGRVTFRHGAALDPVDVTVLNILEFLFQLFFGVQFPPDVTGLTNGNEGGPLDLRRSFFILQAETTNGQTNVGPFPLLISAEELHNVYFVGSDSNGTLTILTEDIPIDDDD